MAGRPKDRTHIWTEILMDTRAEQKESVVQAQLRLLEKWSTGPWPFLTGVDTDGRTPIIWTTDELSDDEPVKAFPTAPEFEYLHHVTAEMWGPERFWFGNKARQMLITTLCALNILWYAAFRREREIFVSRVKEESAIKLINDKIRAVWNRFPTWIKLALPMDQTPAKVITFEETASTITAVSQNFAVSDARGPTGSLILVDEAAYQDFFPEIWRAVLPMTGRLWAISTANAGNRGAELMRTLVYEGWSTSGEPLFEGEE